MDPTSSDAALLKVHEAFLVRLARSLVRDVHEADDVVQEAYAAALERRPDPSGGLRAWLAAVVRNQVRFRARTRARRDRREKVAARPEASSSTADLLAREELRRKVMSAVVALPDPYREVVLLRYLEDLPPRRIAKQLDVPVETVRTRLWRARERLRAALDDAAGGRKGAGFALLAPWFARGGGGAGLGAGPAWGTLAMTTKTKVALALTAALLLAVLAWQPWVSPPDPGPEVPEVAEAGGVLSPAEPEGARLAGRADEAAPSDPSPVRVVEAGASRRLGTLRGRALYRNEGVPGVRVTVRPTRGRRAFDATEREEPGESREIETDARGGFSIADVPEGTYAVEAEKDGFLPGRAVALVGTGAPVVEVTMTQAYEGRPPIHAGVLDAQVVDEAGEPVEGATVACTFRTGVPPQVATSDAEGQVQFVGLPYVRNDAGGGFCGVQQDLVFGFLDAEKDGLVGRQAFNLWRHLKSHPAKPIVLGAPGCLKGRLVAPPETEPAGTRVRATALTGKFGMWGPRGKRVVACTREADVGEDGAFVFDTLPPGTYYLTLSSPRGLRVDRRHEELGSIVKRKPDPAFEAWLRKTTPGDRRIPEPKPPKRNSLLPVKVEVKAGETTERDLAVIAGVTIRGQVRATASARGVPGARVEIELAPNQMGFREFTPGGQPAVMLGRLWTDDLRNPISWTACTTDARGRYELSGLMPSSRYFVRVPPHGGLSFDQRFVETGAAGETADVAHDVERAGSVLLIVRSGGTYSLRFGDAETDAYAFVPPWSEVGVVEIPGLRPGRWSLHSALPGHDTGTPVLTTFEVRSGEETRVDAVHAGDCRIRGCVLRHGRPVAGANVWVPLVKASRVSTGEDGRFDIHFPSSTFMFGLALRVDSPEPGRPPVLIRLVDKWLQRLRGEDPSFVWEGDVELPDGGLRIRVENRVGEPVANAELQVMGLKEAGEGEPGASHWVGGSGKEGDVTVEGLQADDYIVTCTFPETGLVIRRRVAVGDEEEAEVRFRATKPASVRVRVLDEGGAPVAKAYVGGLFWDPGVDPGVDHSRRMHWAREIAAQHRTDERGEAVFEGLPPGRLRFWTSVKGVDATGEIDVAAGETQTLELVVPDP